MEGSGSKSVAEPDPYKIKMDPDPGGPKTYGTDPDPEHCL